MVAPELPPVVPSISSNVPHPDSRPAPEGAADYLFSRSSLHDCHFRVGNADGDVPAVSLSMKSSTYCLGFTENKLTRWSRAVQMTAK